MKKDNGGAAFPVVTEITKSPCGDYANDIHHPGWPGMSLRDFFAAMALNGYYSCSPCCATKEEAKVAARVAYEVADEMLEERKR